MSSQTALPNEKPTKPAIPPGMVIGPDGRPCKICTAFRTWGRSEKSVAAPPNKSPTDRKPAATSVAAAFGVLTAGNLLDDGRPAHCPPDVEQLGRATWTFLHTTAAYYPDTPTPSQQTRMLSLLNSLPTLYPCSHCAEHLGKEMAARPPDVSGREGLGRWLCNVHNEVNERLGKEMFDCSKVDERWKDGPKDGSCD